VPFKQGEGDELQKKYCCRVGRIFSLLAARWFGRQIRLEIIGAILFDVMAL
jgi:hypothetical protein